MARKSNYKNRLKEALDAVLREFTTSVITEARRNLSNEGKASGRLGNSLDARYKVMPNSIFLEFSMEDYGMYVDRGVNPSGNPQHKKGTDIDPLTDDRPFSFGAYQPPAKRMVKNLADWLETSGGATFKSASQKQQAGYTLAMYMREKGIEATLFFTKPYRKYYQQLPQDIMTKFGFTIEEIYNYTIR